MERGRFTEEQIIAVLREQEAGVSTAEVCRKHGVSTATFYKWKSKFGGLEVSDAKRLRALEDENGRLKRMLADAMLDNPGLSSQLDEKWGSRQMEHRSMLPMNRRADRFSAGDEAWFCRPSPRIAQQCRATRIRAISSKW